MIGYSNRIGGPAAKACHTEVQLLLKEMPRSLIQEGLLLCVYYLIALRFRSFEHFVLGDERIPASSVPLTFHSITNGMDCEFGIESELHFDDRKVCAELCAIPVQGYLYVCLVIE